MEKINVAIVDDNVKMVELLGRMVEADPALQLAGKAYDGEEACSLIRQKKPDVVVLDLVMPKLDGLSVMEHCAGEPNPPSFLVLSAIGQEKITEDAFRLGADYFVRKPFDGQMLLRRIRNMGARDKDRLIRRVPERVFTLHRDLETDVTQVIQEIGVPAHVKGYQYLRDGIILAVNDMEIIKHVTKTLYPAIAKKRGTTPCRVERAMRNAIELAFARGKIETLGGLFGYTVNNGKGKPTNSEFIALIADKIRLEYKKESSQEEFLGKIPKHMS